jgi:hypothetical protein
VGVTEIGPRICVSVSYQIPKSHRDVLTAAEGAQGIWVCPVIGGTQDRPRRAAHIIPTGQNNALAVWQIERCRSVAISAREDRRVRGAARGGISGHGAGGRSAGGNRQRRRNSRAFDWCTGRYLRCVGEAGQRRRTGSSCDRFRYGYLAVEIALALSTRDFTSELKRVDPKRRSACIGLRLDRSGRLSLHLNGRVREIFLNVVIGWHFTSYALRCSDFKLVTISN